MGKVIDRQEITLNGLISQCNLAVKNMRNERTSSSDNRRLLIFNCALALRQMQDTLIQVEAERDALKTKYETMPTPTLTPAPASTIEQEQEQE